MKKIYIIFFATFFLSCTPKATKIGLTHFENNEPHRAKMKFEESIVEDSDYDMNHFYLAQVEFALENYTDALTELALFRATKTYLKNNLAADSLEYQIQTEYEQVTFSDAISQNIEDAYLNFLEKFPDSHHKSEILDSLDSVRWQKVKNVNSKIAFQEFVKNYPKSKYVQKANAIISQINEENAYKILLDNLSYSTCNSFLNLYTKSEHSEELIIKRDSFFVNTLLANDDLDEMQKYLESHPADLRKDTINWMIENYYVPRPLSAINTDEDEWYPFISADDKRLYFIGANYQYDGKRTDGVGGEDVFYSERNPDGTWGKPIAMPKPINSYANEGGASVSADYNQILFVKCGSVLEGSCDIASSYTYSSGQWTDPEEIDDPVNTYGWEADPCLSSDKKTLYFVARGNDYGGHSTKESDIFQATLNSDGYWTDVRAVSELNTNGTERAPFIHPDGKTIYFSSDGHKGSYGNSDIYMAKRGKNGKWENIKSLGPNINTYSNEICFRVSSDGNRGYFDRRGFTDYDIYYVNLSNDQRPEPLLVVNGFIIESQTGDTLTGSVKYYDLSSNNLVAEGITTLQQKEFVVVLPSGKEYTVFAQADDHFFQSKYFDTRNLEKFEHFQLDLNLIPIQSGKKATVNNIQFNTGKASLTTSSIPTIENLFQTLQNNPSINIEILGHTDNVGDSLFNIELSKERAGSVKKALLEKGVDSDRIDVTGLGATQPIEPNDTEIGRKANRRVEILIK